jgi:uncharacterized membrane protein YeaQ/YmgE (transglycosylase-associated protein family)
MKARVAAAPRINPAQERAKLGRAVMWTFWGLAVQIIAGFCGAHAAASVSHDHRFGFIGHSLAGLLGGALSGTLFQSAAITILNGGGAENPSTPAEIAFIHALTGGVAGAIAMFAVAIFREGRRRPPE